MWFLVQLCSSWRDCNWHSESCSLFVVVELLVIFLVCQSVTPNSALITGVKLSADSICLILGCQPAMLMHCLISLFWCRLLLFVICRSLISVTVSCLSLQLQIVRRLKTMSHMVCSPVFILLCQICQHAANAIMSLYVYSTIETPVTVKPLTKSIADWSLELVE